MPYRAMQSTCSGFGTGRLQQEVWGSEGRRLGRPWPKNGPKHRRRKKEKYLLFSFVSWSVIFCHILGIVSPMLADILSSVYYRNKHLYLLLVFINI
jgi:hypothetical protein